MTGNTQASADDWQVHDEHGFLGLVGPVMEHWDGERLTLGFTAADKHRNQRGVVQGGMLMTLADRVMGQTLRMAVDGQPVATVQLDTHFVSAGVIGEFIQAEGRVVRLTKSLAFMEGRLTVDDRLVMTANGLWKRLRDDGTHATNFRQRFGDRRPAG